MQEAIHKHKPSSALCRQAFPNLSSCLPRLTSGCVNAADRRSTSSGFFGTYERSAPQTSNSYSSNSSSAGRGGSQKSASSGFFGSGSSSNQGTFPHNPALLTQIGCWAHKLKLNQSCLQGPCKLLMDTAANHLSALCLPVVVHQQWLCASHSWHPSDCTAVQWCSCKSIPTQKQYLTSAVLLAGYETASNSPRAGSATAKKPAYNSDSFFGQKKPAESKHPESNSSRSSSPAVKKPAYSSFFGQYEPAAPQSNDTRSDSPRGAASAGSKSSGGGFFGSAPPRSSSRGKLQQHTCILELYVLLRRANLHVHITSCGCQ